VRVIIDEPVRGSVPPPWFWALPGIDRIRAFSNGLLPLPPLWRLQGIRAAHVGPGSGTWTMPATAWTQGGNGVLEISAFVEAALTGVAMTALPPGMGVAPVTLTTYYFRPNRPQPGNLLARGRVVNTSGFFAFADLEIEDPEGRRIAQAGAQFVIHPVEPPPPPPPLDLKPVEEPVYATPDPYLRPVPSNFPTEDIWEEKEGFEVMSMFADGRLEMPYNKLYGMRTLEVSRERMMMTLSASEWFCGYSRHVSPGVLMSLANATGWAGGLAHLGRGESSAGLDQSVRFYHPVVPDGRPLRAHTGLYERRENLYVSDVKVHDADGKLIVTHSGTAWFLDRSLRRTRAKAEAKRILTTLLFTDIVGSTGHAERLGDAKWRALLETHRVDVRKAIARHEGVEIDTAGDGFFARFDSPGRALECARAVRAAGKRLGIELRAGIHTGECETRGREVTGMAVHLAARIQAAAAPGEILVSGTVKDLAVGSALRFEDRGEHRLKGVPGEWRLYALAE